MKADTLPSISLKSSFLTLESKKSIAARIEFQGVRTPAPHNMQMK
jgi:hypothetical protein